MTTNLNYLKTHIVRNSLLAIAIGTAIVTTGVACELGKSDWAAWVQAIGSIVAIAVAFAVGDKSSRRARAQAHEMEQRQIDRKHQSICAILDDAILQCREVLCEAEMTSSLTKFSFLVTYDPIAFSAALTSIQAIPLHELSGYHAVRGISALRNAMITVQRQVDIPTIPPSPMNFFDSTTERDLAFEELRLSGRRTAVIESATAAASAYNEAITALAGNPLTAQPQKYVNFIRQIQESHIMAMSVVNEVLDRNAAPPA